MTMTAAGNASIGAVEASQPADLRRADAGAKQHRLRHDVGDQPEDGDVMQDGEDQIGGHLVGVSEAATQPFASFSAARGAK